MQGLIGYTIRRLIWVPFVLVVVSFLAFTITRLGPGDYVDVLAGPRATEETKERIKEQEGLNDPIVVQYIDYMRGVILHHDLGESHTLQEGYSVWELIWPRMLVSIPWRSARSSSSSRYRCSSACRSSC